MLKAPNFWWKKFHILSYVLLPLAKIYSYYADKKFNNNVKTRLTAPSICVGNYSLGGSGKTPFVRSLAEFAQNKNLKILIVMRGYGGNYKEPHLVDLACDNAQKVGDEAMLLAEKYAVFVIRNRSDLQHYINLQQFDLIIFDDGFQSQQIEFDYSVIIYDAVRGNGNGNVFPSGPLRASLDQQIKKTDNLIIIAPYCGYDYDLPVCFAPLQSYKANLLPYIYRAPCAGNLVKRQFCVFCAIGNAKKFFLTIESMGGIIAIKYEYPDHQPYNLAQIQSIYQAAKSADLDLVTTAKDYVKLKWLSKQDFASKFDFDSFFSRLWVIDVIVEPQDFSYNEIIEKALFNFEQKSHSS